MEPIRIATVLFCVLLLLRIVLSVRREHIRVEYSMAWFGAVCTLLALCLSDTAMNWIADLLDVHDFAVLLVLLAGVAFLFTFFSVTVEVSELKDHNIVVGQKLGMLEWTIEQQAAEIRLLEAKLSEAPAPSEASGAEHGS